MGYTKNSAWVNGDASRPLNADRMNHIEDGVFTAAATADSAATSALAANGAAATAQTSANTANSAASALRSEVAAPHPRVRKVFTTALFTLANQSAVSLFWPQIIDLSKVGGTGYGILYSTDHAVGGTDGIYLMTKNELTPGGWTDRGRIFRDTSVGTQSETPSQWFYNDATDEYVMLYQQSGVGTGVQSTLVAKTTDPLDWDSWVKHGIVLQQQTQAMFGDGHCGYALVSDRAGQTYAWSLYGGTVNGSYGLWRPAESGNLLDPWQLQRVFRENTQLTVPFGGTVGAPLSSAGSTERVRDMRIRFTDGGLVMWRGTAWLVGLLGNHQSDNTPKVIAAPYASSLADIADVPVDITPATVGWDAASNVDGIGTWTEIDGRWLAVYRSGKTGGFGLLEAY